MPAIMKAQTTKQAKAAYKARGRPALSDKAQRQLERAIELEARADRLREVEKRKAKATKKRAEQEKKTSLDKESARLGSQRRTDKFGFVASQFHLGKFFGRPAVPKQTNMPHVAARVESTTDQDEFGSHDLDDEVLLEVLESPQTTKKPSRSVVSGRISEGALMPPPPRPVMLSKHAEKTRAPTMQQDLSNLWDDLESSTQIARELGPATSFACISREEDIIEPDKRTDSFCSADFDLTEEDLDELDPPKPAALPAVKACPAMAPPPLPLKECNKVQTRTPARLRPSGVRQQKAIKGPFLPASSLYCSPELGFTSSQLESFIDDDIQLTQAVPG